MGHNTVKFLQVGQGRLGQLISQSFSDRMLLGETANHHLLISRLDPVDGLELANQAESKMIIDKMVICVAPGSERKTSGKFPFVSGR